ncbi:methyltransferase regulatory domain-containing protein [Kaarinaea lacus]
MQTSVDYDAVPYEDCPLIQTRPDNLGLIAKLFGINSAPPDNCRVLELGCASGGNIIPLAYYWPNSHFTGIELSEKQAELGNEIIRELQLTNIDILHENILALDKSLGTFDYVIAHGVYSWVPANVQDHMLKLISQVLSPNGVAFVSYNTLPGWHLRMAIRDIMLFPTPPGASPEEKKDNGIAMLKKLYRGLPETSSLSEKWLKKETEFLLKQPSSYLLHDYLEENNNPVYFHQFMEKAQTNHLQFLSEADMYTMLGSTLTEEAENELEDIEDLVEYQQYMDFYYLRYFRQTLLCHDNLDLDYELDIDKVTDCHFTALLNCAEEIDLDSENKQVFRDPRGESFDISHPLTKSAIVALSHQFPNSYSYSQLLDVSRQILSENDSAYIDSDPDELLEELFNLYLSQGIELSQVNREFIMAISDKPKINNLASAYIKYKRCCIGSMHHGNIALTDYDRFLLSLLDGNNTAEQVATILEDRIRTDTQFRDALEQQGKNVDNLLESTGDNVQQSLYFYALNGFLEK